MTTVRFSSLLAWEMRQILRSRLLWLTLAIIAATFIWGATSGAALHRDQALAQARTQERERAWMEEVRVRAEKYRRAAEAPVPYWQDPTDVAGFSQYFLLTHSYKPHLTLSPLAVGVSDLLPDRQQIKLATPFGANESYDFQNPRGLAIGRFDLAFAVVHLLPIAIILVAVFLGTYERDQGMLRLVAAQSVSPRRWMAARLASLTFVFVPALAALSVFTLSVVGVQLHEAGSEIGAAVLLVVSYSLFWLSVCALVLSSWPRAASALAVLVAVWLGFVTAVPLIANAVATLEPPALSAAKAVDAERRVNDELQERRDQIVEAAFRAHPQLASLTDRAPQIDYSTRLSFLVPELESRLEFLQEAEVYTRRRNTKLVYWIGFLAPNIAMESAFATLAGTDLQRHWDFEQQSREYQLRLRRFFYPLMYREVVSPTPHRAYGRFSFTDYDSIPRFEMRDRGPEERVRATTPILTWLILVAAAFTSLSFVRLRRWPEGL